MLNRQIQTILDDDSQPVDGEERLAALTAGERAHWAHTRLEHFFKGTNRTSLDAIEKAAFFVSLDDVPYEFDKVGFSDNCFVSASILYVIISHKFYHSRRTTPANWTSSATSCFMGPATIDGATSRLRYALAAMAE